MEDYAIVVQYSAISSLVVLYVLRLKDTLLRTAATKNLQNAFHMGISYHAHYFLCQEMQTIADHLKLRCLLD